MSKNKVQVKPNDPIFNTPYFKQLDNNVVFNRTLNSMYSKTLQMFKYNNIDEIKNKDMLEICLQRDGYAIITKVNSNELHPSTLKKYEEGLYVFSNINGCNLVGPNDVSLLPISCVIANASMGISITRIIDTDCVLILNDRLKQGLDDTNQLFAKLLTDSYQTIRMKLVDMRYSMVFSSPNDLVSQSITGFLNDIEDGKFGSIRGEQMVASMNAIPKSNNANSIIDCIEIHQYLIGCWSKSVGLKDSFNMKRESLSESEVNSDLLSLIPQIDDMNLQREQGLEKLNKMFGLESTVQYNSSWYLVQNDVNETNDDHDANNESKDNNDDTISNEENESN